MMSKQRHRVGRINNVVNGAHSMLVSITKNFPKGINMLVVKFARL